MYKIEKVRIKGFWKSHRADCKFQDDVNVIIGRNGTGKTTFMNILHAALSLDIEELADSEFEKVTIKLSKGDSEKTIKTIKVIKEESGSNPYQQIIYQISDKDYILRIVSKDDRLYRHMNRRIMEEASGLKLELSKLVSLSSLSVYRMRNFDEYEGREKKGQRIIAPVDYKLDKLMGELTRFQFELSRQERDIAVELQKDVLTSILYEPQNEKTRIFSIPSEGEFSSADELKNLKEAYSRLQLTGPVIEKRITTHIEAIDTAVKNFRRPRKKDSDDAIFDFVALEAFARTKEIVKMSLDSEEKSKEVFRQLNLFLTILGEFIPEKRFSLGSGGLEVVGSNGKPVDYEKLSSGEKQLLILLVEALLQKEQPFIYLADEPELSLHIDWQKKVIPSIRRLNPNAQIIVATHSPEIAGGHSDAIVDMTEIVNV